MAKDCARSILLLRAVGPWRGNGAVVWVAAPIDRHRVLRIALQMPEVQVDIRIGAQRYSAEYHECNEDAVGGSI